MPTFNSWPPSGMKVSLRKVGKVFIYSKTSFIYLGISLYWSEEGILSTRVYRKPHQELKYVSRQSTYTSACLHAIPTGFFQKLLSLTSVDDNLLDVRIDEVYPNHMRALLKENLFQENDILTFGSLWQPHEIQS